MKLNSTHTPIEKSSAIEWEIDVAYIKSNVINTAMQAIFLKQIKAPYHQGALLCLTNKA